MDSLPRPATLTNPQRVRGFIFDLAMLAGNIFFIGSFLESAEDLPERTIGILLSVAVVTQLLGAVLKTRPLHFRVRQKDRIRIRPPWGKMPLFTKRSPMDFSGYR